MTIDCNNIFPCVPSKRHNMLQGLTAYNMQYSASFNDQICRMATRSLRSKYLLNHYPANICTDIFADCRSFCKVYLSVVFRTSGESRKGWQFSWELAKRMMHLERSVLPKVTYTQTLARACCTRVLYTCHQHLAAQSCQVLVTDKCQSVF